MRFFENGPSIPDELLIARDEGRVVFFCGAGVSRARAKLSDFFGLANNVIQNLHVPTDHPACKLLNEAREIDKRTGINGLISADRIFSLLERDFLARDIESAVAKALQPSPDVDLSAHHILLDLATTPEGKVRLVTTNFDRLFDDCNSELLVWQAPRLPEPSSPDKMDGIIYLHGCTNKNYSGAEGDTFILSSSEFGSAYISDGWATAFVKKIIDQYIVVFVGYSADDPPVQYLLEGLNKNKRKGLRGVYAFQSGTPNEASGKWYHKGIEAIAYTEEDGHRALWETLEAWAVRAKAPEEWYRSVIEITKKEPENLQAHERGQVAHIISTHEGARKFAESDSPPPATWLCVFDPKQRFSRKISSQGSDIDPFDRYGLDSDIAPNKMDPDALLMQREIPSGAWNAFVANRSECQNQRDDSYSAFWGNTLSLTSRLNYIGLWLSNVADQPTSVWWAASQTGLHSKIQQYIKWKLIDSQKDVPSVIRRAWRYLFEAWDKKSNNFHGDWYELKAVIDKDAWDSADIRKYAILNRPYLKASQKLGCGPKSFEDKKALKISDLFQLEVKYSESRNDIKIPDEWLAIVIREHRKNLEYALQLETELGNDRLINIDPIILPYYRADVKSSRQYGLMGEIISFSYLFKRLISLDVNKARQEFATWPVDDDIIFSRLRIWASGKAELVSAATCGQIIKELINDAFWKSLSHQRDLLSVLAKRWKTLQDNTRQEIEKKLLKGQTKSDGEEDDQFEKYRALAILNCLTVLANKKCDFSFYLEDEISRLRKIAPNWKPEYASKLTESIEKIQGCEVRRDTEYLLLLLEPLSSTLSKVELSGRMEDFPGKETPFARLSNDRPVRAFVALTYRAKKKKEYPKWAWNTFLISEARKKDKPKLSALIAERLSRYPNEAVISFINSASRWILRVSKQLASDFPKAFDKVISKFIDVLRSSQNNSIIPGKESHDWALEALNAPVGQIAMAIFNDQRVNGDLEAIDGFPKEWIAYVENLLSLDGDLRRDAIVIFSEHLNWFYAIDPSWTEIHLLSVLDGNNENDQDAFWSGLWNAQVPNQKLYIWMKPYLLAVAKEQSQIKRGYCEVLVKIIVAEWVTENEATRERYISNDEMRDVLLHTDDEFRSRILWQFSKEASTDEEWSARLLELLRDVWPRQKSVKTSTMSARLCDLVFSNTERFSVLAEIILPLLITIDRESIMLPDLRSSKDNIADLYPNQTLSILHAVLPDNVTDWPYGIEETLQRISEADSRLNSDKRLLELKRKWNAR
ncbi:MAG TPA: hypothetical protein EYP59_00055 [Thiotrichaceae bacterium]|nr:hypothetical protein [Thiotrichaceae bacterium]